MFTEGVTFTVKKPADVVFHAITDFQNYGLWNTWSPSFKFEGEDSPSKGSRGILSAKALKRNYELPVEVFNRPICAFDYLANGHLYADHTT